MDAMKEALAQIDIEPVKTGKQMVRDNYEDIMALVAKGLSRAEIYRQVSSRIDLGMTQRSFSTYLATEARKRRGLK